MLVIKNLKHKVGEFSLKIENLEVKSGGITLLVGHSGSGKSTLLNATIGLIETDIDYTINSENTSSKLVKDKGLGVVLQDIILFDHMTASKNCFFAAKARGYKLTETQLKGWFEKVGIADCYNKKTIKMSGGERQRLSVLRALSGKPKAIIMDEPFSALDEENKKRLFRFISGYAKENNIPALVASHEYADLEKDSIGIIKMSKGKVL